MLAASMGLLGGEEAALSILEFLSVSRFMEKIKSCPPS